MRVCIEKNMLGPMLLVQFEINEHEFTAWQFKSFGCAKNIAGGCHVAEALYLLNEFYKYKRGIAPIQEVQVEVTEPQLKLPPS